MKKNKVMFFLIILFLFISFVFSGCTILDRLFGTGGSNNDNQQITISGNIEIDQKISEEGPIIVCMVKTDPSFIQGDINVDNYDVVEKYWISDVWYTGGYNVDYSLDVNSGDYFILVFMDVNEDHSLNMDSSGKPSEPYDAYPKDDNGLPFLQGFGNDVVHSFHIYSPYVIKNHEFDYGSDSFGMYQSFYNRDNMLNDQTDGDYLQDWNLWIDDDTMTYAKDPEFIIGNGTVSMKTNYTGATDNSKMYIAQYNIDYDIKNNSKFEIKYNIKDFGGSDFYSSTDFVAPLRVIFTINNFEYLARGFTIKNGDSTYGETNVIQNQWNISIYDLVGLDLIKNDGSGETYTLQAGDVIGDVKIESYGLYWDVEIDYFNISE